MSGQTRERFFLFPGKSAEGTGREWKTDRDVRFCPIGRRSGYRPWKQGIVSADCSLKKIPGVSSNAFPGTAKPSERGNPRLPEHGFERRPVFPTHPFTKRGIKSGKLQMRRMSVLLRIHECYGIRRTRGGTAILPFRRKAFEEHRAFSNGATEQSEAPFFL